MVTLFSRLSYLLRSSVTAFLGAGAVCLTVCMVIGLSFAVAEEIPEKAKPLVKKEAKETSVSDKKRGSKSLEKPQLSTAEKKAIALYKADVLPMLQKHCFECHCEEDDSGDLNLESLTEEAQILNATKIWESVNDKLTRHEMPPEGSSQPNNSVRAKFFSWVEMLPKNKFDCNRIATDASLRWQRGYVMSRRINRAEYSNSIRDLFGIDINPGADFPEDGSGGVGFNNTGTALFTSPILMEKYLAAAENIIEPILVRDKKKSPAELTEFANARKKILFVMPSEKITPTAAATQILNKYAKRIYRRPVSPQEIASLLKLFQRSFSKGQTFSHSLSLPFQAMLISPKFLFQVEPEPEKGGVYRLGQYQFASRLALFLWSSVPDDRLLTLAQAGTLYEKDVLRAEIKRMLNDPRAAALGKQFGSQWFEIRALGGYTRPDKIRFPDVDEPLLTSMRQETEAFVAYVFQEDRSLLELIDSDYTFVNERLARHYGIANVTGSTLRKVTLTKEQTGRGGVLGHASMHVTTSYPLRSSPVLRGKWILEVLLGEHVSPPPPGTPALSEDDQQEDGLTVRQRFEKHRSDPKCAACHQKMDPLGFGMENFDATGRWRVSDNGQPIDSSGKLPSGKSFTGPKELKKILLTRKNQFLKNLTRKMVGYSLGRELNKFDNCIIQQAIKELPEEDYRAHKLIEIIVFSYPFQNRYAYKE